MHAFLYPLFYRKWKKEKKGGTLFLIYIYMRNILNVPYWTQKIKWLSNSPTMHILMLEPVDSKRNWKRLKRWKLALTWLPESHLCWCHCCSPYRPSPAVHSRWPQARPAAPAAQRWTGCTRRHWQPGPLLSGPLVDMQCHHLLRRRPQPSPPHRSPGSTCHRRLQRRQCRHQHQHQRHLQHQHLSVQNHGWRVTNHWWNWT